MNTLRAFINEYLILEKSTKVEINLLIIVILILLFSIIVLSIIKKKKDK